MLARFAKTNVLARFAKDESGNIITVLALSTLTLLGAVSGSLDYSRMTNTRAALAAAADAAALAAAQAPPAEAARLARQVFDANFREAGTITSFTAEPVARVMEAGYRVAVTADVPMTLTRMMGGASRPVSIVSEVASTSDEDIQVALVLDVTGSMAGQKLADLKTSASNMVDTLFDKLKRSNQVKIGVVPFAEYVNIGKSNGAQKWVEKTTDYQATVSQCSWRRVKGSWVWQCEDVVRNFRWDGCVGSRDYPLNIRDENYLLQPVPGVFNVNCPPQILTLSTSRPSVLRAINDLTAGGATYLPAGLMWGWATLSPVDPFNEPADNKRETKRYLVLMTDGENTVSPSYPYHDGGDTNLSNRLTAEICTNIKAAKIEIFSIAFQVTSGPVKSLLQNCASTTDKYFDAANSTQLSDAFTNITRQLASLRITK